jgi:SAM-dependent methyltransferase
MSQNIPVPPAELLASVNIGPGDYVGIGRHYLNNFVELGGLKPDHRVLDVGCGIGRMAFALTGYLDDRGSYEGFDVVADSVRWCRHNITPSFPRFRFQVAGIHNHMYSPDSQVPAWRYRFQYPDGSFDFAILTSVFTHMLPAGVDNYLAELNRVLKPGGRALVTFYLINEESRRLMDQGRCELRFEYRNGCCYTEDANRPEHVVAYDEGYVRRRLGRFGFALVPPLHLGCWCGRAQSRAGQDMAILTKTGGVSMGVRLRMGLPFWGAMATPRGWTIRWLPLYRRLLNRVPFWYRFAPLRRAIRRWLGV